MSAIKRPIASLIAVVGMIAAALALACAGSASAAPYSNQATVSVSTTTPAEGASLTVSGTGFQAGETVNITLHTDTAVYTLGSPTADSSGAFSTSVTLPSGVTGSHTIVADGLTSGASASVAITIGAAAGGGGTTSGGGGGLATTGVAVLSIAGVGVLLLLGGGAMLLAGRRRKATV